MGQPESQSRPRNIRCDGWTVERQLRFLAALSRTKSVTKAAASVGMSRESAHRLRVRAGLFAALWDETFTPGGAGERHDPKLSDGWLTRLLGNHFRRKSNGFNAGNSPRTSP